MLNSTNYKNFNNTHLDVLQRDNKSKHNPPAVKEWNNSYYAFNYNVIRPLAIKDNTVTNLIKSYFNFVTHKKTTKSKRMRDLIRRSTSKQIYVSKAEIKQTNEKAIITVYLFDREKQFIAKRMLTWFKQLRKILISNKKIIPRKFNIIHNFKHMHVLNYINIYTKLHKLVKHLLCKGIILKREILEKKVIYRWVRISPYSFNFNVQFFYFIFYRWVLSTLNIFVIKQKIKINGKKKSVKRTYLIRNGEIIYSINKGTLKNLLEMNFILRYFILKNTKITSDQFNLIKNDFIDKYRKSIKKAFIKKCLKHVSTGFNYLSYIAVSQNKITTFIPYLKALLTKIYNKKIEINVINLRHIHLNTDTLLQAMGVKLRNKTSKVTRVLKKSLKLIRIDESYKTTLRMKNQNNLRNRSISYLQLLTGYKGLSVNYLYQNSEIFGKLSKILFSNKTRKKSIKNLISKKINKTLFNIKYKWVTGVCLLANGRLTKRYTASRAVHKIRYYGSLQNFDYLEQNTTNTRPSAVLLRGINKANVQNSYITGKRRIGAFGIKGWLSGN